MRRILLDYAREHNSLKRGSGGFQVTLEDRLLVTEDSLDDILVLDESLRKLAARGATVFAGRDRKRLGKRPSQSRYNAFPIGA
jgi:hypothetical protein